MDCGAFRQRRSKLAELLVTQMPSFLSHYGFLGLI
jgi:hypothetical protein